jgi:hypothetical protein
VGFGSWYGYGPYGPYRYIIIGYLCSLYTGVFACFITGGVVGHKWTTSPSPPHYPGRITELLSCRLEGSSGPGLENTWGTMVKTRALARYLRTLNLYYTYTTPYFRLDRKSTFSPNLAAELMIQPGIRHSISVGYSIPLRIYPVTNTVLYQRTMLERRVCELRKSSM